MQGYAVDFGPAQHSPPVQATDLHAAARLLFLAGEPTYAAVVRSGALLSEQAARDAWDGSVARYGLKGHLETFGTVGDVAGGVGTLKSTTDGTSNDLSCPASPSKKE